MPQRFTTFGLVLVSAASAWANSCPGLTPADQTRLAQYVAVKFQLPASANLRVDAVEPLAENQCHYRVSFVGKGPLGPVRTRLVVSPDFRYLSTDLFDTFINPEKEARAESLSVMARLNTPGTPSKGETTAKVTVAMFSDFECPFCAQFNDSLNKSKYINNGKDVRFLFKNLPLNIHPLAEKKAALAACATLKDPQKFWTVADLLFASRRTPAPFEDLVKQVGDAIVQPPAVLTECLDKQLTQGLLSKDAVLAHELRVDATPTIFINGQRFEGALSTEQLDKEIGDALEKIKH